MNDYRTRLTTMEGWYEQLVKLDDRERLLLIDYAPHETFLRALRGQILDVGGGAGIAARFLDPDVRYVVVDPADVWTTSEWVDFGRAFRAGGPEPEFINAAAEALPYADNRFDAVLSF
jgi:ubiquinone/menaquinone biosynthesis C-methylase UbiE